MLGHAVRVRRDLVDRERERVIECKRAAVCVRKSEVNMQNDLLPVSPHFKLPSREEC
jgi:hypothetical protein